MIDNKKTAQLVLDGFSSGLNDIVMLLESDDKTLYDFLDGVFEYK